VSFLFPAAWWLGGLALPVIAFYLLKTRQRRREVSTLLFWDALKPRMENSPLWRKLRRWISLLAQLFILFLLIAALAHPGFDWEKSAPHRVAAILDPSASMQAIHPAPGRWPNALAALEASIAQMRVQDEMALLVAENPPRILSGWTSSKRILRNALKTVSPLPTATDPNPAFELAGDLTKLRENSTVEVFSDTVWKPGSMPLPKLTVRGLDDSPPDNAGITLFAIRRSPVAPGDWQLDAEVLSTKPFSGMLELLKDGQPMDLVECTSSWKKTWRGSSEKGAHFEARLKTSDLLRPDNTASCDLSPLAPLQVLVVGEPDAYLEAALDSIPLVRTRMEKSFPSAPVENVDLIIAIGNTLPDAPGRIPLLLIHPEKDGFWGTRTGTLTDAPITEVSKTSPLVRHAGLGTVVVNRATRWQPPPGSEILAADMEAPLLFGQWEKSPRWLVMGFDPQDSDLPLRTAFPILVGNLLQSLRNHDDVKRASAVLPGAIETRMQPLLRDPGDRGTETPKGISVPGWWLVALAGLLALVGEWYSFTRRITD